LYSLNTSNHIIILILVIIELTNFILLNRIILNILQRLKLYILLRLAKNLILLLLLFLSKVKFRELTFIKIYIIFLRHYFINIL